MNGRTIRRTMCIMAIAVVMTTMMALAGCSSGSQGSAASSGSASSAAASSASASSASAASASSTASSSAASADASAQIVGGWTVQVPETTPELPERAQAAFTKATQGVDGMTYTPVALLATQVVAGTNYLFLCTGSDVVETPNAGFYVMKVYEDLSGNAEITSVEPFDLLNYTGN